jgi:DNA-binding transcriptional MerR regulator
LLARAAGFSVSETKTFLSGFQLGATPAARWRALAQQKLSELDALIDRVAEMKALLEASFRCDCRRLEDCERLIAAKNPLQRLRSKRRSMQRQHS